VSYRSVDFLVFVHLDAVVKDGYLATCDELACGVELGSGEGDVVTLPLAARERDVDLRRCLSIDRRGLTIGVELQLVLGMRVVDLNLVLTHQEHAAVTSVGPMRVGLGGHLPLEMQLAVAVSLLGREVAT